MTSIEVEALTKRWEERPAVDAVSCSVKAGELVALLGPSGCGKSTTLRLVAGLEEATSGRIAIGGKDVTRLPPAKRGVSMVFQNYALFPHLSVRENIVFGLKVRDVPRAERDARLERTAALLGLGALLDRKPSQLSGGQQQRVALGRAIISEASVCLMDEPLSNLDAQLRGDMRREIRALQRRLGMTMLYVTHDQVEAMTMADRVLLMRDGRVEQEGPPEALYERPATIFTARFIGMPAMNVLPLAALGGEAGAFLQPPQGHAREDLAVGVRPETIRLGDQGVPADVVAVEYLGADTLVETRAGGETVIVRASGRPDVRTGGTVRLNWDARDTHWFSLSSGRRID